MFFRDAPLGPCASGAALACSGSGNVDEQGTAVEPCVTGAGEGPGNARASDGEPLEPLPAAWFRAHVDSVWRVVARLGVPAHSIDDVVQEAFIVASRRRRDIGSGQERSYLIATAIRLCSNYRQKAHVRREVSRGDGFEQEASPAPDAEQLLIERGWRELLDQVLSGLSDAHRAPFVLYELEGFSVAEIAQLLELPLGTVSSRLFRARTKFSELAASFQSRARMEDR